MKVLQFTIPVPLNRSIVDQKEVLPYFYPHLHRHNEIQLTWIKKGEGTLIADNNMHNFRPNEIYLLGANQPHVFKSEPSYFSPKSKRKVVTLDIYFNPEGLLGSLFDLPEIKIVKSFLHRHQTGFKIPQDHVIDVSARMLRIHRSSGLDQLIHFMELLKFISNQEQLKPLCSSKKPTIYNENEGIRIGAIYDHIIKSYNKPITLNDVAKKACMTPQAFCRYFKKHTRQTLVSFLNKVRINEACKKFTDGSYESISSVAYNCGFNSLTNFNRVFKGITKMSPREYVEHYFQNLAN